MLQGNRCRY